MEDNQEQEEFGRGNLSRCHVEVLLGLNGRTQIAGKR